MLKHWLVKGIIGSFLLLSAVMVAVAQRTCATGTVMERFFQQHPQARLEYQKRQVVFEEQYAAFRKNKQENKLQRRLSGIVTIPVVVHVVLDDPTRVTDEQIQSQLDVLNADYGGYNADRANVPAAFAAATGGSQIRFCLAQRTPNNDITNGIVRVYSSTASAVAENDPVKYSSKGGSDAWDISKYLNIWVCKMENENDLGYSFMPQLPGLAPGDQGLVAAYTAFGTMGTATAPFNKGRTATHEIGHFFNLWHIWGANDCVSSCSDTDFVDDTPNQDKCTYGSPTFPQIDNCSGNAPGIMFMNFMDYVNDAAMLMFTQGQVDRMETALEFSSDRKSLMSSNGCIPPVLYENDAQAELLGYPANSIISCATSFMPVITVRNLGAKPLTSITLNVSVDNGTPVSKVITMDLSTLDRTTITGSLVNVTSGYHTVKIFTTLPNGVADANTRNDTLSTIISVTNAQNAPIKESFENGFPPNGWGISNNSSLPGYNPVAVSTAAHSGNNAVKFNSYQYNLSGKYSVLSSPQITVPLQTDSVKVTFWRAAAQKNASLSDTLQVLYSIDCGQTFQSVYKIAGAQLNPKQIVRSSEYVPIDTQWVADTVNLSPYIAGKESYFIVQFRAINGYGNNIYLDDVNIYGRTLPEALKENGLIVTPNPTRSNVIIQHYPAATNLRGIAVYSSTGQLVWQQDYASVAAQNYIEVNLANKQSGIYFVKLVYTDKTVVKKILKLN